MAVLPWLDGLVVRMKVNDEYCQEYEDASEVAEGDNKVVSKYIMAESGAHFAVDFRFSGEYPYKDNAAKTEVSIDGESLWSKVWTPKQLGNPSRQSHEARGIRRNKPDGAERRPFMFSELIINENADTVSISQSKVESLGEVVIKLYRMSVGKWVPRLRDDNETSKKDLGTLSDKTLKGHALSHTMSLGDPVPATKRKHYHYDGTYLDPRDKPFATYKFKYRSREALKSLCVIPRSPTPVPLEDRPVESLSPDELRELVHKQKERLENTPVKTEVKRERSKVDDDGDEVEYVESRSRKSARTSGKTDVVDLTLD